MNRVRTLTLLTAALVALLLAGCVMVTPEAGADTAPAEEAAAAESGVLAALKERGQLVVGTSADYPPYESVDDAGNFVGFDMDLIREIGARLGVEVEIQDMAFDGLIASLQEGKIDAVIAAMQATPERDEQVDFSVPYHFTKDGFLVAADADIALNAATDAAGYSIGVQTGTIQEKWVLENLVTLGLMSEDALFRYERADQGALDVSNGRIDILLIQADPARELAEQMGLKIALETSETVAAGQAIALPDGAADLKAEIDRIIEELTQEGFITGLQETYGIP